jgi:hypothetical protein
LLLIIILFYFFSKTKLKQKNKLKDIQSKIQENIINASVTGQEIERKNSYFFLQYKCFAVICWFTFEREFQNQIESEEIGKPS